MEFDAGTCRWEPIGSRNSTHWCFTLHLVLTIGSRSVQSVQYQMHPRCSVLLHSSPGPQASDTFQATWVFTMQFYDDDQQEEMLKYATTPYFHIHYNSSFITTLPCPRLACEFQYCQWCNTCGSKPNLTGSPLLSMHHVLSRYTYKCDFIYAHKDVASFPELISTKLIKC